MKHTVEELANTKFGKLTLREPVGSRKGQHQQWMCECECGNQIQRRQDYILRTTNPCCGCESGWFLTKSSHHSWTGVGDMSGYYFGRLKRQARERDYEFSISPEYAWEVFLSQEGRCALTGIPLVFNGHKQRLRGLKQTASLDRIDSQLGYVKGNVQWIYVTLNKLKNNVPQDEFIGLCRLIAARHPLPTGQQHWLPTVLPPGTEMDWLAIDPAFAALAA